MKYWHNYFSIVLLVYLSWAPENVLYSQNKKALVVAIGHYPDSSGFREINAQNDVNILKSALKTIGIKEKDIWIIKDEQATKSNIVAALNKLAKNILKPGDICYFHFSGHGQQVQDLSGDELDGYDEAWAAYDALSEYKPGKYSGQNHVLDDEVNVLFTNIRKKLGPKGHLLACIDACHSGTSTRHIGISRGVDVAIASPEFLSNHHKNIKESTQSEISTKDESKMASMINFFASMANQLNYEIHADDGNTYGALSYAFCKALKSLSSGSSYQQLFDKIRIEIQSFNPSQIPKASGLLAQPLLGGKFLGSTNYFLVKEFINSKTVIVDGGFLQGLRTGTVVGFYAPESRDEKSDSLMVTGVIESSQFNSCKVKVNGEIAASDALRSWVKIKEENFGDLNIKVKLEGTFSRYVKTILDSLFLFPFLIPEANNPDLVIQELDNKIIITTNNDVEIKSLSSKSSQRDLYHGIKMALVSFGQVQFIKKINQENKDLKLEFELLLANKRNAKSEDEEEREAVKTKDGKIIFKISDTIKIKVTNLGTKPAYYSMLDIQPNYLINVLFPRVQDSPSDYYIEPGKSVVVNISFKLDPPAGQELFKLVASKNPINLRALEQRRAASDPPLDPFSKIINDSYYKNDETMTRGYSSPVPAGQVNIFSVPFLIEP